MDDLSEDKLITLFDQLVAEGGIIYGPHTTHTVTDNGYPLEFRICPALSTKPHTISAPNKAVTNTHRFGPGSDLFCPDPRLLLTSLNAGSHDLALNLFCVDRPQLLILTADSFKRQHELLDANDFSAALEVLNRWRDGRWYVIFNCGEKGGCSRVHKHLQGLKGPPYAFDVLVGKREGKVPFRYFSHRFEEGFGRVEITELQKTYSEMLERCRDVLEVDVGDYVPHNVVLWDGWLVVIPRRSGVWEGASANTGGMLGSIWVPNQDEVDKWLQLGCGNVLRELGVPS